MIFPTALVDNHPHPSPPPTFSPIPYPTHNLTITRPIVFTVTETDVSMDGAAAIFFVSYVVSAGWILIQVQASVCVRTQVAGNLMSILILKVMIQCYMLVRCCRLLKRN